MREVRKWWWRGLLALVLATPALPAPAGTVIRLASLEWPPFAGAALPDQGAHAALVRAALAAAGDTLEVEFFPWQRAVDTGLHQAGYAGYFPEYYSEDLKSTCLFSAPAGSSPLGLVERVTAPVSWTTLADLKGKVIGTVEGYVNTESFDRAAAAGELTIESAKDDLTNLRKVGHGRIPLAVIDANVLAYTLAHEPSLAPLKGQLQFNARPLEAKQLYICFRKDGVGEAAKLAFDAGLAQVDAQKLLEQALSHK